MKKRKRLMRIFGSVIESHTVLVVSHCRFSNSVLQETLSEYKSHSFQFF